jgi:hypothetical protein
VKAHRPSNDVEGWLPQQPKGHSSEKRGRANETTYRATVSTTRGLGIVGVLRRAWQLGPLDYLGTEANAVVTPFFALAEAAAFRTPDSSSGIATFPRV